VLRQGSGSGTDPLGKTKELSLHDHSKSPDEAVETVKARYPKRLKLLKVGDELVVSVSSDRFIDGKRVGDQNFTQGSAAGGKVSATGPKPVLSENLAPRAQRHRLRGGAEWIRTVGTNF
jgi:hypothetical protein